MSFILTICTFWGNEESLKTYDGLLAEHCFFSDSMQDVQKKYRRTHSYKCAPDKCVGLRLFLGMPGFQIDDPMGGGEKIQVVAYWMKQC